MGGLGRLFVFSSSHRCWVQFLIEWDIPVGLSVLSFKSFPGFYLGSQKALHP